MGRSEEKEVNLLLGFKSYVKRNLLSKGSINVGRDMLCNPSSGSFKNSLLSTELLKYSSLETDDKLPFSIFPSVSLPTYIAKTLL